MTREDVADALYTGAGVTQGEPHLTMSRVVLSDHPRAIGTMRETPTSRAVARFKTKVKRFLSELEDGMTVEEVLELLDEE